MSDYGYDDRPRRHRGTREREPEYVETTYVERGGRGAQVRDLVYRSRDRDDSIEDIPRDFPPPGAEIRQTRYRESYEPRRARSANYGRGYDERYDYGHHRHRDYDDYSDDDHEHRRPRHERRKSVVDAVKDLGESVGLGGVIAAVTGRSRSRSRSRHRRDDRGYESDRYGDRYHDRYDRRSRRHDDDDRSHSRSRSRSKKKWEQAAKAAIVAGAVEAFRSRKEPGPWTGEKGQRVATAALGAAGIDGLVDKDPDRKGKRHIAEAAIGGLLANRLANGRRSTSRGRDREGRSLSRSRSRSRSIFGRGRSRSRGRDDDGKSHTIRDAVGAGAVLATGKALYDRLRSKSRSRRDRSRSVSSEDSYVPSRHRHSSRGGRK